MKTQITLGISKCNYGNNTKCDARRDLLLHQGTEDKQHPVRFVLEVQLKVQFFPSRLTLEGTTCNMCNFT